MLFCCKYDEKLIKIIQWPTGTRIPIPFNYPILILFCKFSSKTKKGSTCQEALPYSIRYMLLTGLVQLWYPAGRQQRSVQYYREYHQYYQKASHE